MLNKKGVVSFILSLALMFSLCNIASAVEMGMDKDKALKELKKLNWPKNTKIMDLDDFSMIEIGYNYNPKNESYHSHAKYHYLGNDYVNDKIIYNKIHKIVKDYLKISHNDLLTSTVKAYGKPYADYYCTEDNSEKYSMEQISSMSDKKRNRLIKEKDLERRTIWNTKNEYICILTFINGTYLIRLWKYMYSDEIGGENPCLGIYRQYAIF